MDPTKKYDRPLPEDTANSLSKLFFWWILPFIKYSYKNDLQIKDLYNCSEKDLSGPLGDTMEKNWEEEVQRAAKKSGRPSLLRVIRITFISSYSIFGLMFFFQCTILKMCQPLVLAAFIKYFDSLSKTNTETGWMLGFGVVVIAFLNVIVMHHGSLGCQRVGMRCRIACCSLIYRKLLKLNRSSLGHVAVGQLVNLLSNDVQRFDVASNFLHYIWIMPIQTVLAAYIMYESVGWAALSGLLAITLQAVPLQGYLSRQQGIYRFKIAQKTDNRVKLMNEITAGIQVIKMYAWEKPFEKVVELARKYEIKLITKTSYIRGFSTALMVFTERATLYLTLITYVLMGNRLTGDIVFSTAQLFNTIQLYMSILYPLGISNYAEAKTSIRRLEEFLMQGEVTPVCGSEISGKNGSISLRKAFASWIPNPIAPTLMDLNVDIKPGTLCCIVGPVGAGKSSLLQILIRELPLTAGHLTVAGSVSFASQESWLFGSSTIRNNILFGQAYLKNRYKDVVRVCALERDFELFPYGDRTLVGERGASLSGGQRARVNLARAVYREADIYLFDDPLSAVDPHVSKHLFEECFMQYLNGKTRILVTHQLQFLKQADLIIVLTNGKIEKIGTFNELSESEINILKQDVDNTQVHEDDKIDKDNKLPLRQRLKSISSYGSVDEDEIIEAQETQELMAKGAISVSVYSEYYKAGGSIILLIFLFFLLIFAQATCNAGDLWVTYWTNMNVLHYNRSETLLVNNTDDLFVNDTATKLNIDNNTTVNPMTINDTLMNYSITYLPQTNNEQFSQNTYINIYTILIILSILLTTARSLLFFKICMNASKNLHNKMFSNVLKAPMRFFDTNPSGRILNRFSKDMGAMDELLPRATIEAIQIFLVMLGILTMVFIVSPWMIAPAFFLGLFFYWFRVIYLSTAQDVKRLEGITRAPVFSHVASSLYGISTIRSSNAQHMIIKEFDSMQDQHTGSWFIFIMSSETFGFYLDVISTIFLAIVTFQFLIFDDGSTLSGNVGLVISQSMILTGMLQHGVRQTAEVASNMTSVERILQYTKLEKEGPFETLPAKKPPRDWPNNGFIHFKNVYLKYIPEGPPVLKNLSLKIMPGEKIGIVGRTGAGKSTLISSLFRLAPSIDGVIEIDGIDTKNIGLTDLRSSISIIPQEPVLFSSSIRYNLDPFGKVEDEKLWMALVNVELKTAVDSLDQNVNEGGSNFSAGQRQLICLARAIVRNNKILVMDEATANVDPKTDALIQNTIRKNFKNCTVLTIAHRLNTIMDSDKVIVMEAGEAVEFAHPHELLLKNNSYFAKMVKETGTAMEETLRNIAENHYKSMGFDKIKDKQILLKPEENKDE